MPIQRKISMLIGFSILLIAGLTLFSAFQRGMHPPGPSQQLQPEASAPAPQGGPPLLPVTAEGVLENIKQSSKPITLVNIWATWCAPCREEFPHLLKLRGEYKDKGFHLALVSADAPSEQNKVILFLNEQGVDFATYIKSQGDMKFIETLYPEWSGALPASLIYDSQGNLIKFWQGAATYEDLKANIEKSLGLTSDK